MKKLLPIAFCLLALPAAAHPGHAEAAGLMAGLAHPFSGLDHLLAMVGVGLWSRRQTHGVWLAPAFVLMMAIGALVLPGSPFEPGLAASVALIGLLLVTRQRLPAVAGFALVSGFALLHGQAHGSELPQAASAAGFLLSSAALLLAGRALGAERVARLAGAAIAATGLFLLASVA